MVQELEIPSSTNQRITNGRIYTYLDAQSIGTNKSRKVSTNSTSVDVYQCSLMNVRSVYKTSVYSDIYEYLYIYFLLRILVYCWRYPMYHVRSSLCCISNKRCSHAYSESRKNSHEHIHKGRMRMLFTHIHHTYGVLRQGFFFLFLFFLSIL